ncbi:MAG TPA: hypothetical protein VJ183_05470 [Chloroflexia bacterium]|nr:hypothetical protein [Chloroflexia bacterium]
MSEIAKSIGPHFWPGLTTIIAIAGIFVTVYLTRQDSIWLLLIFWLVLLPVAILLCIVLREQAVKTPTNRRYFYSMALIIGLICFLLGLSPIAFGDIKITLIAPPTPTSTLIPTVTQSTPTPTSTATQGDLLETWAYRTRMWESPALIYPEVELKVESQPDAHPSYVFEYQFQSTTSATYGAFNFELFQTPDLSAYNDVQIKFRFSDERTTCYIGLADIERNDGKISLGKPGTEYWTTVKFPLDRTFPGVNLHAITQVYILADDPGDGSVHQCIINEIRFIKP